MTVKYSDRFEHLFHVVRKNYIFKSCSKVTKLYVMPNRRALMLEYEVDHFAARCHAADAVMHAIISPQI